MPPSSFMEEDLVHLRQNLRRMYLHVKTIITRMLSSLREWRPVDIEDDVAIAEELKNMIEDQATLFIARYQPLGRELLEAKTALRIAYDLYRIARYAREITILVKTVPKARPTSDTVEAAEKTIEMIDQAFQAYYEKNPEALRKVKQMDQEIDEKYHQALKLLEEKETLTRTEACKTLILRHLERMADHAVYIATTLEETQTL